MTTKQFLGHKWKLGETVWTLSYLENPVLPKGIINVTKAVVCKLTQNISTEDTTCTSVTIKADSCNKFESIENTWYPHLAENLFFSKQAAVNRLKSIRKHPLSYCRVLTPDYVQSCIDTQKQELQRRLKELEKAEIAFSNVEVFK